ncbi:MAG TPA: hypothetical protein PLE74_07720 [Candidatus Cloacimonadota bacterium]|nr:hypothetical protein [Candidatus Cloacimonadota bacterium]HPT72153.1 hypothetical protein [Candidatus Cloacimonadota bacterium]
MNMQIESWIPATSSGSVQRFARMTNANKEVQIINLVILPLQKRGGFSRIEVLRYYQS